jgi:hypothetical protein
VQRARGSVDLVDPGTHAGTYGRTVYDFGHDGLDVGLAVDHDRYLEWLVQVLGRPEPR